MDSEISYLLEKFASTPGQEHILKSVAEDVILPKIIKLSQFEIYIIYLTIIAFPSRSTKHGKILIDKLIELKAILDDYLELELVHNWEFLPEWVRKIFIEKGYKSS